LHDPNQVSRRIQQILNSAGVNQQEFARMAGISQPAVSQYLRGRIPPALILLQLARMGQTSVEWILTGERLAREQRISEPAAAYGRERQLLSSWRKLPPPLRRDLLMLIHQLAALLENAET